MDSLMTCLSKNTLFRFKLRIRIPFSYFSFGFFFPFLFCYLPVSLVLIKKEHFRMLQAEKSALESIPADQQSSFTSFLKTLASFTGDLSSLTCPSFLLAPTSLLEYS
jgi:hypothetical protein